MFTEVADAIHLSYEPTIFGDVALYGQDYVSPSRRNQVEYDFEGYGAEHAVLVAHGAFESLVPHAEWSLPSVLSSSSIVFDVALLGDDHTPAYEDGRMFATYPGLTERTATDQRARTLAERAEERGVTTGVHPAGFAAACLYKAGREEGRS